MQRTIVHLLGMSAGSQSKETAEKVRIGETLKYEMQSSFGYMDEVDLRHCLIWLEVLDISFCDGCS